MDARSIFFSSCSIIIQGELGCWRVFFSLQTRKCLFSHLKDLLSLLIFMAIFYLHNLTSEMSELYRITIRPTSYCHSRSDTAKRFSVKQESMTAKENTQGGNVRSTSFVLARDSVLYRSILCQYSSVALIPLSSLRARFLT